MIYPNDPTDPDVREKLTRTCKLCAEPPGRYCTNMPISADRLTGRLVHYGR